MESTEIVVPATEFNESTGIPDKSYSHLDNDFEDLGNHESESEADVPTTTGLAIILEPKNGQNATRSGIFINEDVTSTYTTEDLEVTSVGKVTSTEGQSPDTETLSDDSVLSTLETTTESSNEKVITSSINSSLAIVTNNISLDISGTTEALNRDMDVPITTQMPFVEATNPTLSAISNEIEGSTTISLTNTTWIPSTTNLDQTIHSANISKTYLDTDVTMKELSTSQTTALDQSTQSNLTGIISKTDGFVTPKSFGNVSNSNKEETTKPYNVTNNSSIKLFYSGPTTMNQTTPTGNSTTSKLKQNSGNTLYSLHNQVIIIYISTIYFFVKS